MLRRLRWLRRLLVDLPHTARLAYCLALDTRVPRRNLALLGGALGGIALPALAFPEGLPLIGELDAVAVTLAALRLFVLAAPPAVVAEHRQLLREHRSRFDRDLEAGRRLATLLASRLRSLEAALRAGAPAPPPLEASGTEAATPAVRTAA